MSLGFTDGAYNLASGTRDAFGALSDDLVAEGLPPMVSGSGDRERADQERIWHERMTLTPGNRKTYGYRWWQGKKWWQIHPDTVAPPGTGNHEARRSNDLKWPYNSDTTAARRAKELAKRHNITREGENFRELWHWTFWGPLGTIGAPAPAGGTNPTPALLQEDDDMLMLKIRGIGTGEHYVALGPGIFRHFIGADPYEMIMQLSRINDDWQVLPASALPAMLRTYGCDLNIWDWRPNAGGFVVLDPLTGLAASGNAWTASGATRAAIAGIKLPTLDPTPIVTAVRDALTAGIEKGEAALVAAVRDAVRAGFDLDEQALASLVNDERDRRERERLAR